MLPLLVFSARKIDECSQHVFVIFVQKDEFFPCTTVLTLVFNIVPVHAECTHLSHNNRHRGMLPFVDLIFNFLIMNIQIINNKSILACFFIMFSLSLSFGNFQWHACCSRGLFRYKTPQIVARLSTDMFLRCSLLCVFPHFPYLYTHSHRPVFLPIDSLR